MRRLLKYAALLALGWVALWILFFSPSLFLVAVVFGLVVRLVVVMDQRDEAQAELWEERFANARPADVVDVPLVRFPRKRGTW